MTSLQINLLLVWQTDFAAEQTMEVAVVTTGTPEHVWEGSISKGSAMPPSQKTGASALSHFCGSPSTYA